MSITPATILHETKHLYLNGALEICLRNSTHATVIGKAKTLEKGMETMRKLELHPQSLRAKAD